MTSEASNQAKSATGEKWSLDILNPVQPSFTLPTTSSEMDPTTPPPLNIAPMTITEGDTDDREGRGCFASPNNLFLAVNVDQNGDCDETNLERRVVSPPIFGQVSVIDPSIYRDKCQTGETPHANGSFSQYMGAPERFWTRENVAEDVDRDKLVAATHSDRKQLFAHDMLPKIQNMHFSLGGQLGEKVTWMLLKLRDADLLDM